MINDIDIITVVDMTGTTKTRPEIRRDNLEMRRMKDVTEIHLRMGYGFY